MRRAINYTIYRAKLISRCSLYVSRLSIIVSTELIVREKERFHFVGRTKRRGEAMRFSQKAVINGNSESLLLTAQFIKSPCAAKNTNEISRAVIRNVSLCARFLYLRGARARNAVNHMARARFSKRE